MRERGLKIINKAAKRAQITPMLPEAMRHEYSAPIQEEITRPPMPPSALPAIYNPIILLLFCGETSSDMYAIDTEVAPDRRKPLAALSRIKGKKVGEKEAEIEKMDEASRPVPMSLLRGIRSAMNIMVNNPNTMPNVENETAKLLWLADNEKSCAKSGKRGWK